MGLSTDDALCAPTMRLRTDSLLAHPCGAWARPVSWGTVFLGHGRVRGDAVGLGTTCGMGCVLPSSRVVFCLVPNARAHLLPEAGATQERTLEAVRCSPMLAWATERVLTAHLGRPTAPVAGASTSRHEGHDGDA